jgi:hypothetical protein
MLILPALPNPSAPYAARMVRISSAIQLEHSDRFGSGVKCGRLRRSARVDFGKGCQGTEASATRHRAGTGVIAGKLRSNMSDNDA